MAVFFFVLVPFINNPHPASQGIRSPIICQKFCP